MEKSRKTLIIDNWLLNIKTIDMNIIIRPTTENDFDDIMEVEKRTFGEDSVTKLTAELLNDKSAEPYISLLAFENDKAVGHILFTKCSINDIENCPLMHIRTIGGNS